MKYNVELLFFKSLIVDVSFLDDLNWPSYFVFNGFYILKLLEENLMPLLFFP